uniref:Putative secreted peptide n=1 Tax=Anopheles braziliensis TaxID=58242 RepID=A0A2M3ZWS9_9DIPT
MGVCCGPLLWLWFAYILTIESHREGFWWPCPSRDFRTNDCSVFGEYPAPIKVNRDTRGICRRRESRFLCCCCCCC